MACLITLSVSPSEGTLQVLCLAVISLAVMISLYVDFDKFFLRYLGALEPNLCFGKKEDRGFWFLIFCFLESTILSRAALALAAASRGLEDVKAEMEQHFHLVVWTN